MGLTYLLLSLPFEVEEVASILQISQDEVVIELAVGRMKNSYQLRELLPTKSKFVTGWDLLEYMIDYRLCQFVPQNVADMSSSIVDELAMSFEEGCESYRELDTAEIWDIANYLTTEDAVFSAPHICDRAAFVELIAGAIDWSFHSLKAGLFVLYQSVSGTSAKHADCFTGTGGKSTFAIVKDSGIGDQNCTTVQHAA